MGKEQDRSSHWCCKLLDAAACRPLPAARCLLLPLPAAAAATAAAAIAIAAAAAAAAAACAVPAGLVCTKVNTLQRALSARSAVSSEFACRWHPWVLLSALLVSHAAPLRMLPLLLPPLLLSSCFAAGF